jgi:hypothetical protein
MSEAETAEIDPRPFGVFPEAALVLTACIGAIAKVLGVLVLPGLRGLAQQRVVEAVERLSGAFAVLFGALLVGAMLFNSVLFARSRQRGALWRGVVVVLSGLVVAATSSAFTHRLHGVIAMGLSILVSVIAGIASVGALREPRTRALGAVVALFALSGLLRPLAWYLAALANERASFEVYSNARVAATVSVAVQAFATLLSAAWLGTRSAVRGRLLANIAVALAFALTYLAAKNHADAPDLLSGVLRASLSRVASQPLPTALATVSAFLVPATLLLSLVALLQPLVPKLVVGALALALLSLGAFEVPLQALAIAVAAQSAMMAVADVRARR